MNQHALRFTFIAPVLGVVLALNAADVSDHPGYLFPLVAGLSACGAFLLLFTRSAGYIALGAAVCVLPMFGRGSLNTFIALWLLAFEVKELALRPRLPERIPTAERILLLAFLALLLSLLGGLVQALILHVDFLILSTLYESAGAYGVLKFAVQSFSNWRSLPLMMAGYLLTALLAFALLRAEREGEERPLAAVFDGLAFGALAAVAVLILQFRQTHPLFSINQNSFWQLSGRYSASFSDPNAFGVCAVILIPPLFVCGRGWRRWLYGAAGALLVLAVPWSGSRTVWFGLVLWLMLLFSRITGARQGTRLRRAGIGLFFLLFVSLAAAGYPPLNNELEARIGAPGLKRAVQTLDWQDGEHMLSSRLIYGRIALAMWAKSPLVGVGLDRFYPLQDSTAHSLGIELNDWRDNANNYYLQVLAEQGLIGLILTLFAFYLFALSLAGRPLRGGWAEAERPIAAGPALLLVSRVSMGVTALLLLTGPHFFFDEVRYLAIILLVLGVSHVESSREGALRSLSRNLLVATLICPIVYSVGLAGGSTAGMTRGVYAKEHGEDGFFAWTGSRARIALCESGREETLSFRALNPDLASSPVTVEVSQVINGKRQAVRSLELTTVDWQNVKLTGLKAEDEPHVFIVEVSRVWSPVKEQGAGDWRMLGVMMKWPESLCPEDRRFRGKSEGEGR